MVNLRADCPSVSPLFFTKNSLRCVERTLINDSESKGDGWGSESEVFEAGVIHSLKRLGQDSALPAWHTGGTTATQIDYNGLR